MKLFTLALLCLCSTLLTAQTYNEGTLSLRLQQRIEAEPESKHLVYALLTDHVDVDALEDSFDARKVSLQQRASELITTLQAKAEATQPAFIESIRQIDGLDAESVRAFWINNVVFFEANKSAISAISNRDDIYWMDINVPNEIEEHESFLGPAPAVPDGVEPGLKAINAPALWQMGYTGYGGVAFGADTGVNGLHPSIEYKYMGYYRPDDETWVRFAGNGNVIQGDTIPSECGDHGTHTVGTMLGLDRNTNDTIGVAFGANWIGAPILCGIGTADNIAAFQWALNPDGDINTIDDMPDVINNSWWDSQVSGGSFECTSVYVDVVTALEAAGIANIFSAGNSGSDASTITAPKNINTDTFNIFCVAALNGNNPNLDIAGFSSRGPSICGGVGSLEIKPEVSAPGVTVRSCQLNAEYGFKSGTSMAAPHVAGAVLLLREAFPTITGKDALRALYHTCTDLGAAGEDNVFGMGIINVLEAFNYLVDSGLTPASPHATNDVLIVNFATNELYCNESFHASFTFENAGTDTLTSVSVYTQVFDNGVEVAAFTSDWTGAMATGGRATIDVISPPLSSGVYNLVSSLVNPNGVVDEKPYNNRALKTIEMSVVDPYTVSVLNADNTTNCEFGSALLFCDYEGDGDIEWYNSDSGGVLLGAGSHFLTPPLSFDQTYYAEVTVSNFGGKEELNPDESEIGGNEGRLIFDCTESFILKSVKVYAESAGSRFFILTNADESWAVDRLVNVEEGEQRVVLDLEIPVDNNLRLGIFAGQNLRYSTEADFPYDLAGMGSIKNSNGAAPFNTYYGFYDWEIQPLSSCERTPVLVEVVPGASPEAMFTVSSTTVDLNDGGEIAFTDASVDAVSWLWDFGDGSATSSDPSPSHTYTEEGTYLVTLTVVNSDGCADTDIIYVSVTNENTVGTNDPEVLDGQVNIFPNPSDGLVTMVFDLDYSHYLNIEVYDALGQKLQTIPTRDYYKENLSLDLGNYSSGLYYIILQADAGSKAFKLVKR